MIRIHPEIATWASCSRRGRWGLLVLREYVERLLGADITGTAEDRSRDRYLRPVVEILGNGALTAEALERFHESGGRKDD